MTKEEWKQTEVYRNGEFHLRFGKLLMKPTSRMSEFVKLGVEYGMKPEVIFRLVENTAVESDGL